MKLIIAGTRTLKMDPSTIANFVRQFGLTPSEIVSGKAAGIDTAGEKYASTNSVPVKDFPADWENFGKIAGPIRNRQMAEYADALLLVWDGISPGSKSMRSEMQKQGKPIFEVILRAE